MKARENPLISSKIDDLKYKFVGGSWQHLLDNLSDTDNRGSIVGPEGRGKSTLLYELKELLENQGWNVAYYRLSETKSLPLGFWKQKLDEQSFVLIDSAGLLNNFVWKLLLLKTRGAGGLVVTDHFPNSLPTLFKCETTYELFEQLLGQLLSGGFSKAMAQKAYYAANGNIRKAFFDIYDQLAES